MFENLRELPHAPSVQMQPIADDAMAIPDKSLVQDSIDPDVSCLFLLLLSRITDGKYAIQKGFLSRFFSN